MIRISGLCKKFGDREVVSGIELEIRRGEIFTLIGPSGSGKTTLLRLINLLDRPTRGSIGFDDLSTDGSEHERLAIRRRMAMVFQKPAVLNTTVEQNISFGLQFRGMERGKIQDRVSRALEVVGLSSFSKRRAVTLSGGEMQRVAIARALVTEPEVLLLDEPTANLDPVSTEIIENLIVQVNRDTKTTVVIATHDMAQGQRLAHRIGVLIDGRLVQEGTLHEIFYRPKGRDIARFVGIDTVLNGVIVTNEEGIAAIDVGGIRIEAVTNILPGHHVTLYIRPEEVTLSLPDTPPQKTSKRNHLHGKIIKMVPMGPFIRVMTDCGTPILALITRRSCEELGLAVGSRVTAGIKASAIHVLPDTG